MRSSTLDLLDERSVNREMRIRTKRSSPKLVTLTITVTTNVTGHFLWFIYLHLSEQDASRQTPRDVFSTKLQPAQLIRQLVYVIIHCYDAQTKAELLAEGEGFKAIFLTYSRRQINSEFQ